MSKTISSIWIKKAEGGYIVDYWKGKRFCQRVFFRWDDVIAWLQKQKVPVEVIECFSTD